MREKKSIKVYLVITKEANKQNSNLKFRISDFQIFFLKMHSSRISKRNLKKM